MIGKWTATMLLGSAAVLGVILGTAHAAGYVWNWTPSVPTGLWRSDHPQPVLQHGQVVRVCLKATPAIAQLRLMGYFAGGGCGDGAESILKPIAALPGDTVDVSAQGIAVNGRRMRHSAQLEHDARGQVLPRVAQGRYSVPPGKLWLVSEYNADSLDSRYFGPVAQAEVVAVVHSVWVESP